MPHFCDECKEEHSEKSDCWRCGACLYKNSKQIPDDEFPLFECLRCNSVTFWD